MAAGKVFGVYWEVSGTQGTILMDGERFNELKIARFNDPKSDRGFKTLYAGSQVPQFSAFFGFDFAGGGLGYFDVKVIEVRDLIEGIVKRRRLLPELRVRPRQRADHRRHGTLAGNPALGTDRRLIDRETDHEIAPKKPPITEPPIT